MSVDVVCSKTLVCSLPKRAVAFPVDAFRGSRERTPDAGDAYRIVKKMAAHTNVAEGVPGRYGPAIQRDYPGIYDQADRVSDLHFLDAKAKIITRLNAGGAE